MTYKVAIDGSADSVQVYLQFKFTFGQLTLPPLHAAINILWCYFWSCGAPVHLRRIKLYFEGVLCKLFFYKNDLLCIFKWHKVNKVSIPWISRCCHGKSTQQGTLNYKFKSLLKVFKQSYRDLCSLTKDYSFFQPICLFRTLHEAFQFQKLFKYVPNLAQKRTSKLLKKFFFIISIYC